MTRRAFVLPAALAAVAGLLLWLLVSPGAPSSSTEAVQPVSDSDYNVIVAVVDDMDDFTCADTDQYLPRSARWLRDQGRCFEDATVASPVCCPARAILSTGQLPHNNGVRRQNEATRLVGTDTVQHDLSEAGVATYGVGKFLNGLDPGLIASGEFDSGFDDFDFWSNYGYYGYELYDDEGEAYEPTQRVHTTVRVGTDLRSFVSSMHEEGRPYYAYAAFYAPHDQTGKGERKLPQPTKANVGREVPPFAWQPELDTRDKLLPFRNLPHTKAYYRAKQATRVRALYDVDAQVAQTFTLLEQQDALDDTVVLFTSDNGYALGENGWDGKAVPYSASVDVPLLAYLPPGLGERGIDERPVDLVDIAPTVYDAMGVKPGHVVDGHSLLSDYRRTRGRLLEFANERSNFVLRESGFAPFRVPTWAALRRDDMMFVQFYRSGRLLRREFYLDPLQHDNLLWSELRPSEKPSWDLVRRLVRELKSMRTCAGTVEQGSANPCP